MRDECQFYINGEWTDPLGAEVMDVVNPATEEVCGRIALGTEKDVDRAVQAARDAFPAYGTSTQQSRVDLLQRIHDCYQDRYDEIVDVITQELGVPITLSRNLQALTGTLHLTELLKSYPGFRHREKNGQVTVLKEPIGVCGLITPWNWPINQVIVKVAPALAAGCTIGIKAK